MFIFSFTFWILGWMIFKKNVNNTLFIIFLSCCIFSQLNHLRIRATYFFLLRLIILGSFAFIIHDFFCFMMVSNKTWIQCFLKYLKISILHSVIAYKNVSPTDFYNFFIFIVRVRVRVGLCASAFRFLVIIYLDDNKMWKTWKQENYYKMKKQIKN